MICDVSVRYNKGRRLYAKGIVGRLKPKYLGRLACDLRKRSALMNLSPENEHYILTAYDLEAQKRGEGYSRLEMIVTGIPCINGGTMTLEGYEYCEMQGGIRLTYQQAVLCNFDSAQELHRELK